MATRSLPGLACYGTVGTYPTGMLSCIECKSSFDSFGSAKTWYEIDSFCQKWKPERAVSIFTEKLFYLFQLAMGKFPYESVSIIVILTVLNNFP